MNIAIFQCIKGEADEHILKFCIVKDYEGQRNPLGTLLWYSIDWCAHNVNHNLVYNGNKV